MDEKRVEIRCLLRKDLRKVTWMDKESERYVGDWIEFLDSFDESSDAYGLFENSKLAAYFTVDEILEGSEEIEGFPPAKEYCWYVNNVYVRERYRGKGYGLKLIDEIISRQSFPVMLIAMTEELISYYEKIGFVHISDQCMIKYPEMNCRAT